MDLPKRLREAAELPRASALLRDAADEIETLEALYDKSCVRLAEYDKELKCTEVKLEALQEEIYAYLAEVGDGWDPHLEALSRALSKSKE